MAPYPYCLHCKARQATPGGLGYSVAPNVPPLGRPYEERRCCGGPLESLEWILKMHTAPAVRPGACLQQALLGLLPSSSAAAAAADCCRLPTTPAVADPCLPACLPVQETAAVIIEPVLGEGGFLTPPPGFLGALRALCDKHGMLLIFDEASAGAGAHARTHARSSKAACCQRCCCCCPPTDVPTPCCPVGA